MFGISGEKLLILGLIAVFVLGPDRLPHYAAQLARLVKSLRRMAEGAKGQLQEELGEELDWKKLDPRQYDPRRIIREALVETPQNPVAGLNRPVTKVQPRLQAGEVAPFDSEAT
ncbi:MAG: sec-independent translocase [Actinomycetota bacterium]